MNDELIRNSVRRVMELLADGKYAELESMTNGIRLNADTMAKAIMDYGRHPVPPPDEAYDSLDIVEVRNSRPRRWSVVSPLWTKEEGRSDLSLEMTIISRDKDVGIELDGIHVR